MAAAATTAHNMNPIQAWWHEHILRQPLPQQQQQQQEASSSEDTKATRPASATHKEVIVPPPPPPATLPRAKQQQQQVDDDEQHHDEEHAAFEDDDDETSITSSITSLSTTASTTSAAAAAAPQHAAAAGAVVNQPQSQASPTAPTSMMYPRSSPALQVRNRPDLQPAAQHQQLKQQPVPYGYPPQPPQQQQQYQQHMLMMQHQYYYYEQQQQQAQQVQQQQQQQQQQLYYENYYNHYYYQQQQQQQEQRPSTVVRFNEASNVYYDDAESQYQDSTPIEDTWYTSADYDQFKQQMVQHIVQLSRLEQVTCYPLTKIVQTVYNRSQPQLSGTQHAQLVKFYRKHSNNDAHSHVGLEQRAIVSWRERILRQQEAQWHLTTTTYHHHPGRGDDDQQRLARACAKLSSTSQVLAHALAVAQWDAAASTRA